MRSGQRTSSKKSWSQRNASTEGAEACEVKGTDREHRTRAGSVRGSRGLVRAEQREQSMARQKYQMQPEVKIQNIKYKWKCMLKFNCKISSNMPTLQMHAEVRNASANKLTSAHTLMWPATGGNEFTIEGMGFTTLFPTGTSLLQPCHPTSRICSCMKMVDSPSSPILPSTLMACSTSPCSYQLFNVAREKLKGLA